MTTTDQLRDRIRDLAIKITPDYPSIRSCDAWEQLWAIEQSYEGLEMALADWHQMASVLMLRVGMDNDEFIKLWHDTIYSQENRS